MTNAIYGRFFCVFNAKICSLIFQTFYVWLLSLGVFDANLRGNKYVTNN